MYQIRCDNYVLYDHRDDALTVLNPRCKLKVGAAGEGSFTILSTHPYYGQLKKLKSVFEYRQDGRPIFRGRMTADSRDFHNQLDVDLEGVLAFTNDSMVPPFQFPGDFPEAASATNMVEYFLRWLIEDVHNGQVEDWQKLKVGTVTVSDPNNYIGRSSDKYAKTLDILKSRLPGSDLGGHLCIRYEDDGNYLDYLADLTLTNTQHITLGENLLDMQNKSDASGTCSAILPIGKDGLTLESLPDGDLTDDLVKKGKFIYSRSAVESYGWICVPVEDSTWDSVTVVDNLKTKAMDRLAGTSMMLSNSITIKAVDLHYSDEQIQSFKVGRKTVVDSPIHGVSGISYPLTELDIDLFNPQNTLITLGDTFRSLVDINADRENNVDVLIQNTKNELKDYVSEQDSATMDQVHQTILEQNTTVLNTAESIIMAALERYVETSNYEEFRQTVQSQFVQMSDKISMNFTTTTEQITNVNGDLQAVVENLSKHFEFGADGLLIKAGENSMNLLLDNDLIRFMKNGQQFGWWDGVDFHTGNIVVEVNERAQFGNFAFVPRSNGSLSFLKVGG
jgi:hypothetical protein